MKINFRKIAPIAVGAAMLLSSAGFALAADLSEYPSPFVKGGVADVAIVYGADADAVDIAGAVDIAWNLQAHLSGVTTTTTTTTTTSGEAAKIETSGQKLYLGDYMNATKEAFTDDDLPTLLADGKVTDKDGAEFTYSQTIYTPLTYLSYGKTSDNLDEPVLHMYLETSSQTYQTKITFPKALEVGGNITNRDITLFGNNYTFSGSSTDLTSSKLVLFEKATMAWITEGEETTVKIGDKEHTIKVEVVEDADTARISVDGTSESVDEGNSYKIAGVDLYVKDVVGPNVAGVKRGVELYVGSEKLTLENNQPVVKGSTTIYGTSVSFSTSSGKISAITITVTPYSLDEQVKYIKKGESFTDPVWGSFKIEFANVVPALESTTRDYINIRATSEKKVGIEFKNKAGEEYDINILKPSNVMLNSTAGVTNGTYPGTYTYNATTLGVDTYDLITTSSAGINENDYFIVCNNEYTQIFRLTRIDLNNYKLRVKNAAKGGASQDLSVDTTTNTTTLTLADGSSATLSIINSTAVNTTKACSYLYTHGGAKIDLSHANAPSDNSSRIDIVEETSYNDGSFTDNSGNTLGKSINMTWVYDKSGRTGYDMMLYANGFVIGGTSGTDYWSGEVGDYDTYYVTKYGTFIKKTGNTDKKVEIYYPSSATYYEVYIAPIETTITPGEEGTTTTTGGGATLRVGLAVKDSEISSVQDKNLIVMGGSAVNSVAAKLLGLTYPTYGSEAGWQNATGITGPNMAIIKLFDSPYATDKVAMLVAGWEAKDTYRAAKALVTGTPALSGTEVKLNTVSEEAVIAE